MKLSIEMNAILLLTVMTSLAVHVSGAQKNIAVIFRGTAIANGVTPACQDEIDSMVVDGKIGDLDWDQNDWTCFQLEMFDVVKDKQVGYGIDCIKPTLVDLSDPNCLGDGAAGVQVEAVNFFIHKKGNMANHGFTSLMPFFPGVGDAGGQVTHLTGSIPSISNPQPSIIAGTRKFKNWVGSANVRLSGAVDMSRLNSHNELLFSCVFIIDKMP